jgi:hypothetical protein
VSELVDLDLDGVSGGDDKPAPRTDEKKGGASHGYTTTDPVSEPFMKIYDQIKGPVDGKK